MIPTSLKIMWFIFAALCLTPMVVVIKRYGFNLKK